MSKIDPTKQAAFLKELSALTRRYRICIAGCGCCGSPWLSHSPDLRSGKYEVRDDENDKLVFVRGHGA